MAAVCGRGSVVEHHLAKVGVAGSNPVVRSRSEGVSRAGVPSLGHSLGHTRENGAFPMPGQVDILRASTGELYRYRLAAGEQLPRIHAAVEAAQDERTRIEEASYELLFAPSMSIEAFEAQLQAIHDRDIPFVWRLKSEVEFLMTAVYGILTMARTIHRFAADELESCVKAALDAFDAAAPDADVFSAHPCSP